MTFAFDNIDKELKAFLNIIPEARVGLIVEKLPAPHVATDLPNGCRAIYAFWGDGEWLKIGKAGPNSNPRFKYQHYKPGSSQSNLANSLTHYASKNLLVGFESSSCGDWIRQNVSRYNIFVPSETEERLISLLEAFLHYRLKPRFEGK